MRYIVVLVTLTVGCSGTTTPQPPKTPAEPIASTPAPDAIGQSEPPKPAVYDRLDFDSTARWMASLVEPLDRAYRTSRSPLENGAVRARARGEIDDRDKTLRLSLQDRAGDEISWRGVVKRVGSAGVMVELKTTLTWEIEGEISGVTVHAFVNGKPNRDHPADEWQVLDVGRQVGHEIAAGLKPGDEVVIEAKNRYWMPAINDADRERSPTDIYAFLHRAHVRGFPYRGLSIEDFPGLSPAEALRSVDAGQVVTIAADPGLAAYGVRIRRLADLYGLSESDLARRLVEQREILVERNEIFTSESVLSVLELWASAKPDHPHIEDAMAFHRKCLDAQNFKLRESYIQMKEALFGEPAPPTRREVAKAPELPPPPTLDLPAARALAGIDAGEALEASDSRVVLMRKQLDRAMAVFQMDDDLIRDYVAANHAELKKFKAETRCLFILEDLIEIKTFLRSYPDTLPGVDALYMKARLYDKQDRKRAVAAVKAGHPASKPEAVRAREKAREKAAYLKMKK